MLKDGIPIIQRITYFSDGCAGQYKNRFNLSNLCHHERDFGIPAEWHFYAASHGKGPSDGLGGTLKRLATKASLQATSIQTREELFVWAERSIPKLKFIYVTEQQVQLAQKHLKNRFRSALPIDGIRSRHAAIPISHDRLCVKVLSSQTEGSEFAVKNVPISEPEQQGVKTRYVQYLSY